VNSPSSDLHVSDFDYDLPPELIAQRPLADRTASRLLVLDRQTGAITHDKLVNIGRWLRSGDLLVANNSRVIPARLRAVKLDTGGQVELLLLHPVAGGDWTALAKPAKKLQIGTRLTIPQINGTGASDAVVEVVAKGDEGEVTVHFEGDTLDHLGDYGSVPLPPYIHDRLEDPERYQTVYATALGSVAAPTAGLHLTKELIEGLRERGVEWAEVTLHIGLDTFRPVTVDLVAEHKIHTEWCAVSADTHGSVIDAKNGGGRVVAVGTTAARTLETLGKVSYESTDASGFEGPTDIFITPGYTWRVVDVLLTNFHLPRSTLLMMVSALAGRENIAQAYAAAIAERYRFYSFGDAMLIV
jgi:S-adenosylmethionine:tRNA ribosyltransferase-isomerase